MNRTILASAAATLLAGAALVGTTFAGTTAAVADTVSTTPTNNAWTIQPTAVRDAPSLDAAVSKVLDARTPVAALCVRLDDKETGTKAIWFRIATGQPGGGWVPREALGGVPALPTC